MSPGFLRKIGFIIANAFIHYEVFPVKLCRASLKNILFGTVNSSDLLSSFGNYLPNKETSIVQQFRQGSNADVQAIIDILRENKIFVYPTIENIDRLLLQAAEITVLRVTYFSFQILVQGMGDLWKEINEEIIDFIYNSATPDSSRIIAALDVLEQQPCDQKLCTWLNRYIRARTQEEIMLFMRYVSGSTTLVPGERIKVIFINQPLDYLRPTSQTCFKILHIPRGYQSFTI